MLRLSILVPLHFSFFFLFVFFSFLFLYSRISLLFDNVCLVGVTHLLSKFFAYSSFFHCTSSFWVNFLLLEVGVKFLQWEYVKQTLYKIFIYLFLAMLSPRCSTWAFSNCSEHGLLFSRCLGFLWQLLLLQSMGFWALSSFGRCGAWAQWAWLVGSRVQGQQLW